MQQQEKDGVEWRNIQSKDEVYRFFLKGIGLSRGEIDCFEPGRNLT